MYAKYTQPRHETSESGSQDSLSQSLLAPAEEVPKSQLGKAIEILDDVETKQARIKLSLVDSKATKETVCKSTLGNIKENLVSVNQILQSEKQIVSDLKTSCSQSQSQAEFAESQTLMKQTASALLTQQKRLLDAFKNQKRILDLLKEEESIDSGHNTGTTTKILSTTITQDAKINVAGNKKTAVQETDNSVPVTSQNQSSSFTIIESKVQSQDSCVLSNQRPIGVQSLVSIRLAGGNTCGPAENHTGSNSFAGTSPRGVSFQKIITSNCTSNKIQAPLKEQPKRRKQAIARNPSQTGKGTKKTPVSIKSSLSYESKIQDSPCFNVTQDEKMNPSTKNTGLVSGISPSQADFSPRQILPSVHAIAPKPSPEEFEISKLKFIVTMKDEEFLESSEFLPENFWTAKAFDGVCIDEVFLKRLDFL